MGRARPTETPPVLWTFCLPPPSAAGLLLFVAAFLTPAEFATSPVILPPLADDPLFSCLGKKGTRPPSRLLGGGRDDILMKI